MNDEDRTTSDFISRDELFEELNCINLPVGNETVDKIFDVIETLPPAQPETAKRIVGKSRDGMTLWYQCDMCNEPVDAQDNFCSGCGRRLTDG